MDKGAEIAKSIQEGLAQQGIAFKHVTHAPARTSAEAAQIRETALSSGVKAIILIGKQTKQNYLCAVPGEIRVDLEAVARHVGEPVKLEDKEVILKKYGLIVGGVPPCGNVLGIRTLFDFNVNQHMEVAFNCGLQTESIVVFSDDLVKFVQPELGAFA